MIDYWPKLFISKTVNNIAKEQKIENKKLINRIHNTKLNDPQFDGIYNSHWESQQN